VTARLSLRLDKYLGGSETTEGAVARLYALDEGGKRDHSRDHANLVIPAGQAAAPLVVDVKPGNYVVEAVLPSGDVATDQVEAIDQTTQTVVLQVPDSPHEWLSWQQYIGNVPAEPEAADTRPRRTRAAGTQRERIDAFVRREMSEPRGLGASFERSSPRRMLVRRIPKGQVMHLRMPFEPRVSRLLTDDLALEPPPARWGSTSAKPPKARVRAEPATRRPPAWPVVTYVGEPVEALRGGAPSGADAWQLIEAATEAHDPLAALSAGRARRPRHRNRDDDREIMTLGAAGPVSDRPTDSGPPNPTPRRYVVAIQARGPAEIACLPVPWDGGPAGRVPIEVLVRRHPLPGEAVLAMSPRDPTIGSALGYMGSGSLANARVIFDRALAMLYGKQINPFGAAAGGYVLLATDLGERDQPWHQWIENLAEWFDWLPDGMILLGRLRLKHRRNAEDVIGARRAMFAAYDRGLPFYSLGLQWLVDGLSLLATDDPESRRRLANVQRVTWRANLQQPFTTIRLRDK
jgi:hypothetical protein